MKTFLKKIRDRLILNAIRSIVANEADKAEGIIRSVVTSEADKLENSVRSFLAGEADKTEDSIRSVVANEANKMKDTIRSIVANEADKTRNTIRSVIADEAEKRNTEILSAIRTDVESHAASLLSTMERQKAELVALLEDSLSEIKRNMAQMNEVTSETKRRTEEEIKTVEDLFRRSKNDQVKLLPNFISGAIINRKAFSPFKNFCIGRELVVCGAGPSLKDYVPIKDAVHIALNRAFLFDKVAFDFIYAQDFNGIKMVQNELAAYRPESCVKFFGTQDDRTLGVYRSNIPFQLVDRCKARLFVTNYFAIDNLWDSKFVYNIDSSAISTFTNVGLAVMQFALWMNPKRIYLVGIDASGNHFTQQGLSEEEKAEEELRITAMWESERERTRKKWEECKLFASIYYPDTEIVSVNPVGLKGIFRDVYQNTEMPANEN